MELPTLCRGRKAGEKSIFREVMDALKDHDESRCYITREIKGALSVRKKEAASEMGITIGNLRVKMTGRKMALPALCSTKPEKRDFCSYYLRSHSWIRGEDAADGIGVAALLHRIDIGLTIFVNPHGLRTEGPAHSRILLPELYCNPDAQKERAFKILVSAAGIGRESGIRMFGFARALISVDRICAGAEMIRSAAAKRSGSSSLM